MSYLIKQEEIGDYRISVYSDEDADCPCTEWDMLGIFIFGSGCGTEAEVHSSCNWRDLFGKYDDCRHSIGDALRELIRDHIPQNKLVSYLRKGKLYTVRMEYNRHNNEWEEYGLDARGELAWSVLFSPSDLRGYDCRIELTKNMSKDELVQIITDLATDIAFYEWSSTGYCQGDYAAGFAYCDKKRFRERCDTDTTNWKERALAIFKDEVKSIGLWMWGDVKSFVLEKKVRYKKIYTDIDREPEDSYEWEIIDSCGGEYFDDADELIEDALVENGISKSTAA